MKRTAIKLANGNWSIRNANGREVYILQKHYHSPRDNSRFGYDKITRLDSGETCIPPYFSYFPTLKQALRSCGCR